MIQRGKYPHRDCPNCSGTMTPRIRANGIKETPREYMRRKNCDVCSPPLPKPRSVYQVPLLEQQHIEANAVLHNWR